MKKKVLSTILGVLLVIGIFYNCVSADAVSQGTADLTGIQYPISLTTGKDAAGKLVFPDAEFIDCCLSQAAGTAGGKDRGTGDRSPLQPQITKAVRL